MRSILYPSRRVARRGDSALAGVVRRRRLLGRVPARSRATYRERSRYFELRRARFTSHSHALCRFLSKGPAASGLAGTLVILGAVGSSLSPGDAARASAKRRGDTIRKAGAPFTFFATHALASQ